LDVLAPLGNGYDLSRAGEHPLLIGGGVGIPPLYLLARQLRAAGKNVQVVLGFNTASEAFYIREFEALGCTMYVTTADGSLGAKGFVTDVIPRILERNDGTPYYYACGPLPMLRQVVRLLGINGEISMEERMGCGFGVCMGCSIQTASGAKRVCTDGPVFKAGELSL
jgi:dihydroorotate dehydrogenase electron transfer subunit